MPSSASEIVYFDGKAALPVHILGMSRFSKAFFVGNSFEGSDNGRSAEEDGQLFGRVIHPTLFGNVVYPGPMYFQANIESAVVPCESPTRAIILMSPLLSSLSFTNFLIYKSLSLEVLLLTRHSDTGALRHDIIISRS